MKKSEKQIPRMENPTTFRVLSSLSKGSAGIYEPRLKKYKHADKQYMMTEIPKLYSLALKTNVSSSLT